MEGGILILVRLVTVLQLIDEGLAEHTLTLAVDEDNLCALLLLIFLEGFADGVELVVQDVRRREAVGVVKKFGGVEVNDDRDLTPSPSPRERGVVTLGIRICCRSIYSPLLGKGVGGEALGGVGGEVFP